MFSLKNIPNFLTILRIVLIPSIVICIEVGNQQYYWIALFLYVTACFSDFFDGYLARKFDIESNFGRFLDPIADKILVVSILIILIANHLIVGAFVYPALVIILREIIVSGLRDFFLHSTKTLLVTNLAKWKTLIQMSSLGFLLVQNNFETKLILYLGNLGLTFASAITIYTGYIYFKKNLKLF